MWTPVTSYDRLEDVPISHRSVSKGDKAGNVTPCTNAYTKNFSKEDDKEEELLHSQYVLAVEVYDSVLQS
jgi:hypothetical protein